MDTKRMAELRRIMYDSNAPMSTRQTAAIRYEKALDVAAKEFGPFFEKIRAESRNEKPVKTS